MSVLDPELVTGKRAALWFVAIALMLVLAMLFGSTK